MGAVDGHRVGRLEARHFGEGYAGIRRIRNGK
ncbi:MAG: hypothetical protein H6Q82_3196, partial [Deltaproteobacteria bacterium]|nr:hypothetical protein [Deltaproteobacteria bacterium]